MKERVKKTAIIAKRFGKMIGKRKFEKTIRRIRFDTLVWTVLCGNLGTQGEGEHREKPEKEER